MQFHYLTINKVAYKDRYVAVCSEKHHYSSGKMKRKWKPNHKQHKNYSHAAHKQKRTMGREDKMRLKRHLKKKQRNKPH